MEQDIELQTALNETYIELLEFAYDHDARLADRKLDREMRFMQRSLDKIVHLSDPSFTDDQDASSSA